MNPFVAVIWAATLAATILGVIPVVLLFLNRTLNAARHIKHYTEEILATGGAIAQNTARIAALKQTIAAAAPLLGEAESAERHLAAIEAALTSKAGLTSTGIGNGQVEDQEALS
ncbi:MAG: hypothetical protein M5U01_35995 [Ardenticatenaceae bacterium]|nr:hypothetical protein [Ardenticatenaceae bacterium]HBY97560.1 hypothetical protein [Chloroflexota bacterium]